MVDKNQHKFHAKAEISQGPKRLNECYSADVSMNFSRTLGESGNWIGAGHMHKSTVDSNHMSIKFPFYSLVYVVSGFGTFIGADGKSTELAAGSLFQRRPGVVHSSLIDPSSGWREYYLDCNTQLYHHLCSMSLIDTNIDVYKHVVDVDLVKEIEFLMSVLQTAAEDKVFDAYLQYLKILRFMFQEQTSQAVRDEMIEQCLRDFDSIFRERFDLKEYCKNQGWGYEKFRKTFKKDIGVSPKDYLIRRRMDEACRLLKTTRMRISEISNDLGYASQYEFSNQFKKNFNVFPKHYRDGV